MTVNEKEILFNIGQKIRIERTKKGFSQEHLAELTNMSVKTLGRIERGQSDFVISNLIAISNALEIEITKLFSFTF